MSPMLTVVLDESCAHLSDAVTAVAPVVVFSRKQGFLCESITAAAELQQMLADHAVLGRSLYVAPSFAGFTALLTAARFEGSLAGVLLLDPSHPRQGPEAGRILAGAPPGPEVERLRSFLAGFGPAWDRSCAAVAEINQLGNLPLQVLAGGRFDLPFALPDEIKLRLLRSRHAMLEEYCALSSRAIFEIVPGAGHDLSHQAPEAVLAAIKRLLGAVPGQPT